MIGVFKHEESSKHAANRTHHLARLKPLSPRTSKDIFGYDSEKFSIWKAQYGKCCYCEQKIPYPFNDVEHYRPKGEAIRAPGCLETHGYWWLAYSWENLFYACASCNRSSKNSLFPLAQGSLVLAEGASPPGLEKPLLADPGSNEAVKHIQFEFITVDSFPDASWWKAVPVDNSEIGEHTIKTVGLNFQDRVECRMNYFRDTLRPLVVKLKTAVGAEDIVSERILIGLFRDLFYANQPFSVFSFSVFLWNFPDGLDRMRSCNVDFCRESLGCSLDVNYGRIS